MSSYVLENEEEVARKAASMNEPAVVADGGGGRGRENTTLFYPSVRA